MKWFGLIFISIFLCCCRPAAALHGTYSSGPDFGDVVYTFNKDSTFTLDGWSCTRNDTGVGKYTVTRDSLILVFDSIPSGYFRPVVFDSVSPGGDSCIITVFCQDEIGPLAFAIVTCSTAQGRKPVKQTDLDGNTRLKLSKSDFPLSVECRYTGMQAVRGMIPSPGDYNLKFRLESGFTYRIPAGTRFAYGLKKVSKDEFVLTGTYTDVDGKTRTNKDVYRKKWR